MILFSLSSVLGMKEDHNKRPQPPAPCHVSNPTSPPKTHLTAKSNSGWNIYLEVLLGFSQGSAVVHGIFMEDHPADFFEVYILRFNQSRCEVYLRFRGRFMWVLAYGYLAEVPRFIWRLDWGVAFETSQGFILAFISGFISDYTGFTEVSLISLGFSSKISKVELVMYVHVVFGDLSRCLFVDNLEITLILTGAFQRVSWLPGECMYHYLQFVVSSSEIYKYSVVSVWFSWGLEAVYATLFLEFMSILFSIYLGFIFIHLTSA